MIDAAGIVTTYGYDNLGRVVTTTLGVGTPLQQASVNQYNAAGWLLQSTDNYLAGQTQNYLSRYNLITRYGYDSVGNRTVVTDTLSHVAHILFDALNRPISQTADFTGSGAFNAAFPDQNITTLTQYD